MRDLIPDVDRTDEDFWLSAPYRVKHRNSVAQNFAGFLPFVAVASRCLWVRSRVVCAFLGRKCILIYQRFTVFFRDLKSADLNRSWGSSPPSGTILRIGMWFNLFALGRAVFAALTRSDGCSGVPPLIGVFLASHFDSHFKHAILLFAKKRIRFGDLIECKFVG